MIILIDNYDSFTYNLYQILVNNELDVKVMRNDKVSVNKIIELNPIGIVISPGPGRPENAGCCVEVINYFAGKVPIFGVCLGHQAIAHAFGGKVQRANTVCHGKQSTVYHCSSELYHDIPKSFEAGRYHSLTVDFNTLPDCLSIDAKLSDDTIMGIRHKVFPIYGVQYHPESILSNEGESIVKNFMDICKQRGDYDRSCYN